VFLRSGAVGASVGSASEPVRSDSFLTGHHWCARNCQIRRLHRFGAEPPDGVT
jgi:hypothetical protein